MAATFSPDDIDGLEFWVAADSITGLSDGDPVTTWADQSGNGRNATQATADAKPLYKTNILNGKPVVRWDGGNDELSTAAPVTTVIDNYTIVAVVQVLVTGTYISPVFNGSGNINGYGFAVSSPTHKGWLQGGVAWHASTTLADTTPDIYIMERAAGTTTVYVDGVALSPTWTDTPLAPTTSTRLGSHFSTFPPLNGDIAEALIYSAALTSGERASMNGYLGAKYGITV